MENLIWGIASLFIAILLGWFGWIKYKEENYKTCLFTILAIGLIFRVFISMDFFLHDWDERYHALVAKNLMEHPLKPTLYEHPVLAYDYKDWSRNHIWVHKQPFPLMGIALSLKLFGLNEFAVRMPSIFLSLVSVFCTYLIGMILFDRKVGLMAAFLHAIHGLTLELTGGRVATDHIDVFFQGLVEFSVLFAAYHAKRKHIGYFLLMTLFCGLAILSKWLPALIVLPLWILLVLHFKKIKPKYLVLYTLSFFVLLAIIVLPWQLWIHTQFPLEAAWEKSYNKKHIFESLQGHGQPFYYHLNKIRMIFGELIYFPIIWLLAMMVNKRQLKFLLLGVWILIPLMFFSIVKTKMQGYLLFTAPAFFILISIFARYLLFIKRKHKYPVIINILVVGLFILPVRYSIERLKPFAIVDRSPQWAEEIKTFSHRLKSDQKQILFGEDKAIEAMFYCPSLTAYPFLPDSLTISRLKKEAYRVFIKNVKNGDAIYEEL